MFGISKDDLQRMNDVNHDDFVLINVLPREDFNRQHIRTSINIPVGSNDFLEQVEKVVADKNRKIVVYCASFDCDASIKAAERLEGAGFGEVFDYEGGIQDWFDNRKSA